MTDLTVAVSESTFRRIFRVLRDGFEASSAGTLPSQYVDISWDFRCHLENGDVRLRDDNTVQLEELDIVVDRLRISFAVDLPRVCVGGQCVVRNPVTGNCMARLPRFCLFDDNPDLRLTLNLDGLFRSEVTGTCRAYTEYYENPGRLPGMSNLDASQQGVANEWRVFLAVLALDVDLFDMPGSARAVYDAALVQAVNQALAPLPGWARDVVVSVLGPIGILIEGIMDIGDDVDEWISGFVNMSTGFLDSVYQAVTAYFAETAPLHRFEDPLEMMPWKGSLIPVFTRFHFVRAEVRKGEMVITAEPGLT